MPKIEKKAKAGKKAEAKAKEELFLDFQ